MSDILDALRKAELQRERSAVPGISTRQRYFSVTAARSWYWSRFVSIALILGVSVAGVMAIYLHSNDKAERPLQATIADLPKQQINSSVSQTSSRPHHQPNPPGLNTRTEVVSAKIDARPSPLKVPGPRTQRKPGTLVAAEDKVPSVPGSVDSENGNKPQPNSLPEKPLPGSSIPESEIEVAAAGVNGGLGKEQNKQSMAAPQSERTIYNQIPSASNPLNQIRPPLAVEVPKFNPKINSPQTAAKRSQQGVEPPLLSTLSYQFQSTVPKLTINAQVYSKIAHQRFVVINMKRYNEGQHTVEGVSVEAIRQEDIVLSYQGQRFRIQR